MANNLNHFHNFSTRVLKQIMRRADDRAMRMKAYGILINRGEL